MGNDNNLNASSKAILAQFTELRREEHELFGSITHVKNNTTDEHLVLKQLNYGNQIQFSKNLKRVQRRKAINNKKGGKEMVSIRQYNVTQTEQVCGKGYRIYVFIQDWQTDLRQEYQARKQNGNPFSQQDAITFLKGVISSLITLYDSNFKPFHLYKETILIISMNNYKIVDTFLTSKINPYYQILNGIPPKSGTYLAPQILQEIKKQNMQFYSGPKSDVWLLGMVLLQMLKLREFDEFYDFQKKIMDPSGIRAQIDRLNVSKGLRNIIMKMLQPQQEERLGLISLKQTLADSINSETVTSHTSSDFSTSSNNYDNRNIHSARRFILKSKPQMLPIQNHIQYEKPANFFNNESNGNNGNNLNGNGNSLNQYQNYKQNGNLNEYQHPNQQVEMRGRAISDGMKKEKTWQKLGGGKIININSKIPKDQPQIFFQNDIKPLPLQQISPQDRSIPVRQPITPINYFNPGFKIPQSSTTSTPIRKIQMLTSSRAIQYPMSIQRNQTKLQFGGILQMQPETETQSGTTTMKRSIVQARSQPIVCTPLIKPYNKHTFSNGAHYEGEFNQLNEFDGNGMLYYPDGQLCYSGSWKNNTFNGFGVLYNKKIEPDPHSYPTTTPIHTNYQNFAANKSTDWSHYEGEFLLDKKDGFGTLFMRNGDKFSGCFKNDCIQGFGTFYINETGQIINGIWIGNILNK